MSNEILFDEKLTQKLIQGDEQSFNQIYWKYSPLLYCRLMRILKSHDLADEILQEVFIAIWNKRSKIDPQKSFKSYLYCIAANKCYDYFRNLARQKLFHTDMTRRNTELVECDDADQQSRRVSMLMHIIAKLPPRRRRIFELCKLNGKSYAEVSSQLGISLSTISDHIVKANNFIKKGFLQHSA